jgi:hypothetical protein
VHLKKFTQSHIFYILCSIWILLPYGAKAQYAENSVLATGNWYKIGVPETGVYKLNFNDLQNLGINTSNLSVQNIGIYGHNGGMLPEMVGSPRIDDLQKIPIQIVSTSSVLGTNDYILFYAEGPDLIHYNTSTQEYTHSKNLYSNFKGYFITTSETNPLRIQNASVINGNPSLTLTEYDDIRVLDDNNTCIGRSGRLWVKDEFDFLLDRNYNFNFPNINSQKPIELTVKLAAFADVNSNRFRINFNNNLILTENFSRTPVTSGIKDYARISKTKVIVNNPQNNNTIRLTFEKSTSRDRGWLDFFLLVAKSNLVFENSPILFRNKSSVNSNLIRYNIQSTSNAEQIWDVTNLFDVKNINYSKTGNQISFNYEGNTLKEFIIFKDVTSKPQLLGKVENQNLHNLSTPDYLIVCRKSILNEAESLASFHRTQNNFIVEVVTYEEIMNEFSSGNNDVSAIRDFTKMLYDKGFEQGNILKYLLLFGDGSYNNKDLGNFNLPTYQSDSGHQALFTYVSDDYFGLMDSLEGKKLENTTLNKVDIAVGRIPADNLQKAIIAVNKIREYYEEPSFKDWINHITLIADDEDNNIHFRDAEGYATILESNPNFNLNKLYLDAFNQVSSSSGATYPDINKAINNQIIRGTHIINYIGHGGPNGLAEEKVITLAEINSWENKHKYPIFITATCEFAPYDKPEISSAGERVLFKENGGAIALLTTVRLVFSNRNEIINRNFYNVLVEAYDQPNICLGDIVKEAKRRSNTGTGNLKFALLGDPALKMRFPKYKVSTTSINEKPYDSQADTAKALSLMTIEGQVTDKQDNLASDFNGLVYVRIFDKKEDKTTLANDITSSKAPFKSQTNLLFAGKTEVKNGVFSFQFVVPKDINYNIGEGKISYYAHNQIDEASGTDILLVGGSADSIPQDNDGPLVSIFLGDTTFKSGGVTDNSPLMIVKLFDENGINASGIGIGRDLVAILNNDKKNAIILNDFYETDLNSYKSGVVNYPLSNLAPGKYTLTVRAWDALNNPGEATVEFTVLDGDNLSIEKVINYPNPTSGLTRFSFEHNRINEELDITISIYTYHGKLVKTIEQKRVTSSFKEDNIIWDGLTDGGYELQSGIYIYNLRVSDNKGDKKSVSRKLVILK